MTSFWTSCRKGASTVTESARKHIVKYIPCIPSSSPSASALWSPLPPPPPLLQLKSKEIPTASCTPNLNNSSSTPPSWALPQFTEFHEPADLDSTLSKANPKMNKILELLGLCSRSQPADSRLDFMMSDQTKDVKVDAERNADKFSSPAASPDSLTPVDLVADEKPSGEDSVAFTETALVASSNDSSQHKATSRKSSSSRSLMTIPGVGLANRRKLEEKGILGKDQLLQMQKEKGRDFVLQFLTSSAGIKRFYSSQIVEALEKEIRAVPAPGTAWLEAAGEALTANGQRLTICIEGNVGVGKSTFLNHVVGGTEPLQSLVQPVMEPVHMWEEVGTPKQTKKHNLLLEFYKNKKRWAYTFQSYVLFTRMMEERKTRSGCKPFRMMERSVFTDRSVFVNVAHKQKVMSPLELSVYDSWYDVFLRELNGFEADAFIYLKADAATCLERLSRRGREAEMPSSLSMEYLQLLEEVHNQWLHPVRAEDLKLKGRKGRKQKDAAFTWLHERPAEAIADKVGFMQGKNVHPLVELAPVMVLDYDKSLHSDGNSASEDRLQRVVSEVCQFTEFAARVKRAKLLANCLQ